MEDYPEWIISQRYVDNPLDSFGQVEIVITVDEKNERYGPVFSHTTGFAQIHKGDIPIIGPEEIKDLFLGKIKSTVVSIKELMRENGIPEEEIPELFPEIILKGLKNEKH